MEMMKCNYNYLKNPLVPLFVTPIIVLTYLGISYLHPANNKWLFDGSFTWGNFFQFVLLDQCLIEFFTYLILSWLIVAYSFFLKLHSVILYLPSVAVFEVKFLPLFLVAFFFINPVTQSIRFGYHHLMGYNPEYWPEYFFSLQLYLTYMIPILLGGYTLLNLTLYVNYKNHQALKRANEVKSNKIEVLDENGKTFIELSAVVSFEYIDRVTYVNTAERKLRIQASLNNLEKLLNSNQFVRINRAAIINLQHLKNYSFWENDKYILRLLNGKEYTVSRDRIRVLKSSLLVKSN